MANEKRLIAYDPIAFEALAKRSIPHNLYDIGYLDAASRIKDWLEKNTVDAAPVVHGRWIAVDSSYWRWAHDGGHVVERITYRCSECARKSIIKTNYCPNCGAKMDEGQ